MAQANGSLPKFAKRHYEAIATAIQEALEAGENNHDPIANVVDELSSLFRDDNGRFKWDRVQAGLRPWCERQGSPMKPTNRRRYFTEQELGKLIGAARKGRYGQRDATLILIMARHGLRVSEAIDLEWDQIDFTRAHLHVRRLKGGIASVHPIQGDELRALREVQRRRNWSVCVCQ